MINLKYKISLIRFKLCLKKNKCTQNVFDMKNSLCDSKICLINRMGFNKITKAYRDTINNEI